MKAKMLEIKVHKMIYNNYHENKLCFLHCAGKGENGEENDKRYVIKQDKHGSKQWI